VPDLTPFSFRATDGARVTARPLTQWEGRVEASAASHLLAEWRTLQRRLTMLRWAWAFLIVALIAAVFGFGGIASGAASIAKILFYLFIAVFVITLLLGLMTGRRTGV
jgi:uncharacterized membrane protein YtjA (UPF0391 family)